MAELPLKPRRSLSNDLIWFYALKITSCAREMLLESARIFQQVDDEEIAGQVEQVLDVLDEQINPGETAFKKNCQTCHTLPRAGMKSAEEWPTFVSRYGARAKLSDEQIAIITDYLQRSSHQ